MAFVVSGSIASKIGDEPERVFRAGEAWWEPPGAVHRVSRNTSSSESARLLAIFIAPPNASESDLTKQL
jgi:quercetin dioxygenase-like cupin family protein